ncbi:hypothetical protein HDE_08043 [Halotydeus destructor]|nr:hypothetical protein HDE_08043 [Halotydeus destructor]
MDRFTMKAGTKMSLSDRFKMLKQKGNQAGTQRNLPNKKPRTQAQNFRNRQERPTKSNVQAANQIVRRTIRSRLGPKSRPLKRKPIQGKTQQQRKTQAQAKTYKIQIPKKVPVTAKRPLLRNKFAGAQRSKAQVTPQPKRRWNSGKLGGQNATAGQVAKPRFARKPTLQAKKMQMVKNQRVKPKTNNRKLPVKTLGQKKNGRFQAQNKFSGQKSKFVKGKSQAKPQRILKPNKDQLDNDLDVYMSKTRTSLDQELDAYMVEM